MNLPELTPDDYAASAVAYNHLYSAAREKGRDDPRTIGLLRAADAMEAAAFVAATEAKATSAHVAALAHEMAKLDAVAADTAAVVGEAWASEMVRHITHASFAVADAILVQDNLRRRQLGATS